MKRNIINLSLFFALSLVFMSMSAMAQASSTTTTERIPISGTITACNLEQVVYEGFVNYVSHMTVSNSGQVNFKYGGNLNVRGVGLTTGARYTGNETYQFEQHFDSLDLAPFNLTINHHFNFIGQGGVPNTRAKSISHVTVNANGELISSRFEFTADCNP